MKDISSRSLTERTKKKKVAHKTDAIRRAARLFRQDRARNGEVKRIMEIENIIQDIEKKQLIW